ncbi:MAG: cysteine synthase A [Oscillospiraceae bacterium]|nr:cysteine synthase A [Oscillospiraceae bacterium]
MIYKSFTELIGKTPMVELSNYGKALNAKLLAKVEFFNPTGSAKDRPALEMINDAEERGLLKAGATIIEPTSGNTGIGLAAVAASRGYKAIIVMPDTMSIERRKLMAVFGAQVVLTPGAEGMQGAINKAEELAAAIEGSFIPDQFSNVANARAHYKTTGPEIWADTEGAVDIFVATVGTGGTLTGTARYLKEKNPDVKVIAVEPASSPLLSKGTAGSHKIQGIGANFVPAVLDVKVYDEVICVTDEESYAEAAALAKSEGLMVGISSGAALAAAKKIAERAENAGKNIVVILPDTGERYLSTEGFIKE